MKLLFLLAVVAIVYFWWKKNARAVVAVRPPMVKRPLDEAQRQLFARLQSALPSAMILAQPSIAQLVESDDASLAAAQLDFAVLGRDARPIGVAVLAPLDPRQETLLTDAGLRVARFKPGALPDDQQIRDAFGYL
ncbi:hypothetical protein [Derxia gummosa]|uniref:DUF2726 domain-containing protein n=1 Tax=Derxia gummosa DSM 723 TaxID=1121388 RepID=A0A8B6X3V5_9BURK|nr:hypothetical protein [Derxia gummosa]